MASYTPLRLVVPKIWLRATIFCCMSVFKDFTVRMVKPHFTWFIVWKISLYLALTFLLFGWNFCFMCAIIAMLGVELGVLFEHIVSSCLIFTWRSIKVGQFIEFWVILKVDYEWGRAPTSIFVTYYGFLVLKLKRCLISFAISKEFHQSDVCHSLCS